MLKYIDIHNHILFGLDDGPKSIMESMKMIDMAAKEGIKTIVATPHVRPGKKIFDHIQYSLALDQLNSYCAAKAYGLQIVGGAEIKWNENTIRLLKQGLVPTMNNTRFVLVEWSASSRYEDICDSLRELTNAGYKVICSHVERYRSLYKRRAIDNIVEAYDVRIQVDVDAILGNAPLRTRLFVRRLLKQHLVDYVATDAHNVRSRPVQMHDAYDVLLNQCGRNYARSLTRDNAMELFRDGGSTCK